MIEPSNGDANTTFTSISIFIGFPGTASTNESWNQRIYTAGQRAKALSAARYHWKAFAQRYEGIPNRQLSFDLINEPPKMRSYEGYLEERYVEITRELVASIREVDPGRLIFADGIDIGQAPVVGLVDLDSVQSTRGYQPKAVSHYTADVGAVG